MGNISSILRILRCDVKYGPSRELTLSYLSQLDHKFGNETPESNNEFASITNGRKYKMTV